MLERLIVVALVGASSLTSLPARLHRLRKQSAGLIRFSRNRLGMQASAATTTMAAATRIKVGASLASTPNQEHLKAIVDHLGGHYQAHTHANHDGQQDASTVKYTQSWCGSIPSAIRMPKFPGPLDELVTP